MHEVTITDYRVGSVLGSPSGVTGPPTDLPSLILLPGAIEFGEVSYSK